MFYFQQLKDHLNEITKSSKNYPAQNRLVYNDEWLNAQKKIINWSLDLGLNVTVDEFGTVYADLPGTEAGCIATGSHIDTVKDGGKFDGLYGVLAGLSAIAKIKSLKIRPKYSLRLISFSEEEGSRFPLTFTGSKFYTNNRFSYENVFDNDGILFKDSQTKAVEQLMKIPGVTFSTIPLPDSFTELHIEQGPILEKNNYDIGLVTNIVGQRRITLTIAGVANHAGTTPMKDRQDALQAAIELITKFNLIINQFDKYLTFTVGNLSVFPNVSNVIPGKVTFTIDFRHPQEHILNTLEKLLCNEVHSFSHSKNKIKLKKWTNTVPSIFDSNLINLHKELASKNNYKYLLLSSGAGHDSQIMNSYVPTAMIFVPSNNGISHAPAEFTKDKNLKIGLDLLTNSLISQSYH